MPARLPACRQGMQKPIHFATVVTDLTTCHNAWFHRGVSRCYVATAGAQLLTCTGEGGGRGCRTRGVTVLLQPSAGVLFCAAGLVRASTTHAAPRARALTGRSSRQRASAEARALASWRSPRLCWPIQHPRPGPASARDGLTSVCLLQRREHAVCAWASSQSSWCSTGSPSGLLSLRSCLANASCASSWASMLPSQLCSLWVRGPPQDPPFHSLLPVALPVRHMVLAEATALLGSQQLVALSQGWQAHCLAAAGSACGLLGGGGGACWTQRTQARALCRRGGGHGSHREDGGRRR